VNANGSGTVYSGDFSVDGDITTEYSWTYSGNSYEFSVTYDYGDYKYYATLDTDSRAVTNYSLVTNFVTDSSGTVQEIANNLISLYQEKYGSNADITGQDFTNFIVAFVQYCYTYMYDSVTYGQDEYFAYPMETIYQSGGDCEDTSILAAAVYEAAGYDAAVGLLPGHAIVGVALSDYDMPTYSNAQEILSQTVDGETYYAGETTATYFIALGIMSYYSSEHGSYSWYSDYLGKGQYGFYPVEKAHR
jgi:transglutaminase-like putative cysteine protease